MEGEDGYDSLRKLPQGDGRYVCDSPRRGALVCGRRELCNPRYCFVYLFSFQIQLKYVVETLSIFLFPDGFCNAI